MIRVVIDTEAFINSFLGRNAKAVINLWKIGKITLCLSPKIVDEYIEVMQLLGLDHEKEINEMLRLFGKGYHIVFTHKTPVLDIITDTPGNKKFIESAVALDAKYIIAGDETLSDVKDYMGIKITSPRDFLEQMMEKES